MKDLSQNNFLDTSNFIDPIKLEFWKNKNSTPATYAQFDEKCGLINTWSYITNPQNIKKHSFFPCIRYDYTLYKVSKNKITSELEVNDKTRPLCYSAHIDRCIYKYYSYLLNEKYNIYLENENIADVSIAYRNNLHKNNVHFAKEAFEFIKKQDCDIIVGDFKSFFDMLNHKHLKRMLCKVLGVNTLPDDWYAIFKNITKYSTWELINILKLNNLITDDDILRKKYCHEKALAGQVGPARKFNFWLNSKIRELNGYNIKDRKKRYKKVALCKEDFKKYKKQYLKVHTEPFGIPQGLAISAILSNVYMIEFDKTLKLFVDKFNGLYFRYSDDFIIVIPKNNEVTSIDMKDYLNKVVEDTDGLILETKKTQIYSFTDNKIINIVDPNNPYNSKLDYLGFVFDGQEIVIRPKTVSKYYYRMYNKLGTIVKNDGKTKNNNNISCKNLYKIYSEKGRNGILSNSDEKESKTSNERMSNYERYKNRNFLTYVYLADEIFNANNPNSKEPIHRSTKRHMQKIRKKRNIIKQRNNNNK